MAVNPVNAIEVNHGPFFSRRCALCAAENIQSCGLCAGCRNDIKPVSAFCRVCAMPIHIGNVCGRCLNSPAPPWEYIYAAFIYAWPLNRLLLQLKFHQNLNAARYLAELGSSAIASISTLQPRPDLMVRVPLQRKRLLQRGYNQAHELARIVGRSLSIHVDADACQRLQSTHTQTGLDARQRRANVRGVFTADARKVRGRIVAVVDDIITTTSTVRELSRSLKQAGAAAVVVWAIAKQPLGSSRFRCPDSSPTGRFAR